jgi:predicted kinase
VEARNRRSRALAGGVLVLVCASVQAGSFTPASAREVHSAQCVAALQVSTESLAQEVRSGREEARAQLQTRLEAGTAFVGDAYLHGTTDERRARTLANDALEAQKSLSAAELAARQEACAAEGAGLLLSSNSIERAIVKRFARKRMDKLLGG